MFCAKCGSNIKDGAGFCPKCGQKVKGSSEGLPAFTSNWQAAPQTADKSLQLQTKAASNFVQKKVIMAAACVAAAVILLIIISAIVRRSAGNDVAYSLVGTWKSEDAVNLENAISKLLTDDAGLPEWAVDSIMDLTGITMLGTLNVTFDERGGFWIGINGMSFTLGAFSYDKVNNDTLLLKYALDVPVIGEISVSYQAKYTLSRDKLTLDLFGVKAKFTRQ